MSELQAVLVLRGTGPPLVIFLTLAAIVLYQLFAGSLINLRWAVWLNRSERPVAYWSVLSVEAAVAFSGLYLGLRQNLF